MKTGTFMLTDYYSNSVILLTVTPLANAVPEPASWALMICGMALVGGTLRARRTSVKFANA